MLNAFRHQRMNHCPHGKSLRRSRLHEVFSRIRSDFAIRCTPRSLRRFKSSIFSGKYIVQAPSLPRTRRKPLPSHQLTVISAAKSATTQRYLITRSERSMPDQPNPIDHRLNAEAPLQHKQRTSALPADRLLDPSHDSVPSAVFPMPHDPGGNGRYCIESASHSLPGFLPLCEGALGLGRHRQ